MASELCGFCLSPCSLLCSNCKKVSYCSKNHQKFDRKNHKPLCFPVKLQWSESFGNHLVATRDIKPGEVILADNPLVVGPRSNLPKSAQICLGCCNLIPANTSYECPYCHWLMCHADCHTNAWHRDFECNILEKVGIRCPTVPDDYLFVTILRCVLLKIRNPEICRKFGEFESHHESRKRNSNSVEQCLRAVNFIQNMCKQNEVDAETIDRLYGILTVNGYSDSLKFFVKLYELGSKISHSCIPNTRSIVGKKGKVDSNGEPTAESKLVVISSVEIRRGEALTQLYGTILTGTYRRQELLQNVYFFTCTCQRCQDPSELGTNFSGVICKTDKCRRKKQIVFPDKPLNQANHWICANCGKKWTYASLVLPALSQVAELTKMAAQDPLYSEFELYSETDPDIPLSEGDGGTISMKADYVIKMDETIQELEEAVVHPHHYAFLPVKTAMIATIYNLILQSNLHSDQRRILTEMFLKYVKIVLGIFNVLCPGMTRDRGIMLFYLAKGLEILGVTSETCPIAAEEIRKIWEEADGILRLEPVSDSYRQLLKNKI